MRPAKKSTGIIDPAYRAKIRNMRDSGMTLDAIGKSFDPPVSRQAVHNILRKLRVVDAANRQA